MSSEPPKVQLTRSSLHTRQEGRKEARHQTPTHTFSSLVLQNRGKASFVSVGSYLSRRTGGTEGVFGQMSHWCFKLPRKLFNTFFWCVIPLCFSTSLVPSSLLHHCPSSSCFSCHKWSIHDLSFMFYLLEVCYGSVFLSIVMYQEPQMV